MVRVLRRSIPLIVVLAVVAAGAPVLAEDPPPD
jgi:hypothetical protein